MINQFKKLKVGDYFNFVKDDKEMQRRVVAYIETIKDNEIVHSIPEFTSVSNTTMHHNGTIDILIYEGDKK